jgi:hypothetical protein
MSRTLRNTPDEDESFERRRAARKRSSAVFQPFVEWTLNSFSRFGAVSNGAADVADVV